MCRGGEEMEKKICIDPGHGGTDPGAVGKGLTKESDINLKVGRLVFSKLIRSGYEVAMTRSNDIPVRLSQRTHRSNALEADVFVSLHCNASENRQAHGIEVWTSPGQTRGDLLAECIFARLILRFPEARFRTDTRDGDNDKEANFYVLAHTVAPACLVEMGFISNLHEENLLKDQEYQEKMAHAIFLGIQDFTKNSV